jgi:hypothetical protein
MVAGNAFHGTELNTQWLDDDLRLKQCLHSYRYAGRRCAPAAPNLLAGMLQIHAAASEHVPRCQAILAASVVKQLARPAIAGNQPFGKHANHTSILPNGTKKDSSPACTSSAGYRQVMAGAR